MSFKNLNTIFTIFGDFPVFDSDFAGEINEVFADCNITIKADNNPNNKAKRMYSILNVNSKTLITLRPNRIDVLTGSLDTNKPIDICVVAMEYFNKLHTIFKDYLGTRIACVSNDFKFDVDNLLPQRLANTVSFIDKLTPTTEFQIRVNTPDVIQDEEINIVLNINSVSIADNRDPQAAPLKAMMFAQDINTLVKNSQPRFSLDSLLPYFVDMLTLAKSKLEGYDEI